MTDEDRMDRAKRIREMREGSRDRDTEESTDGGEPPDAEQSPAKTDEPKEPESEEAPTEPERQTMEGLAESAAEKADEEPPVETATNADDPTGDGEPVEEESTADEQETASDTERAETEAHVEEVVSEADADDTDSESDTEMNSTEQFDSTEGVDPGDESDRGGVTAPLPGTDALEDALAEGQTGGDAETAGPDVSEDEVTTAPAADAEETEQEEETRVLEFRLDNEHYCLNIEYIEEIVKEGTITRVPNTPDYVQGVVDLRGQITTILNPKVTLGKDNTDADELIVVFDAEAFEDQGHIGWVVDDVRQVSPITESEVSDPPVEEEYINGVIDREDDDQFVIWTSPELALEEAGT